MVIMNDSPTLTCVDGGWIMSGIIGTVTFAWVLLCHLINTPIVPTVVSTERIVGIRPTHQEFVSVGHCQHSDIIITVLARLPLHQAQVPVPVLGLPADPLLQVLRQVSESEIVDNVPGSYQEGGTVLSQQFEVVRVRDISREGENIICKI